MFRSRIFCGWLFAKAQCRFPTRILVYFPVAVFLNRSLKLDGSFILPPTCGGFFFTRPTLFA